MFGFGSKRKPVSRLETLLADYPACTPPHLGHVLRLPDIKGPVLTPEQTRENFLAYRVAVSVRMNVLQPVLAGLGLNLDEAYTDAASFVRQLHPTLLAELPPLYRPDLADRYAWELSDRSGKAIVLSFLADLAMLNGDVLVRAYAGVFWGQNLDRRDRLMFSYRRPCLIGLADRLFPHLPPAVFFLEGEWFGYYKNMDDSNRLAMPDGTGAGSVIGDSLIARLERYHAHPDIARLRAETWMKDAA